MACFPILRSMAYGFAGSAVAAFIALPLHAHNIISDDVAVGIVLAGYVLVGLGRLVIFEK